MKKIIIIALVVLVAGGILIGVSLASPVQMTPAEITAIKSNCAQCHSTPPIGNVRTVHSAHNGFECSTCHQSSGTNGGEDEEEGDVNPNVCASCHSEPLYSSANQMHDKHATTECTVCHPETAGLAAAQNAHDIMKKIGIGLVITVVTGLFLNSVIARIRLSYRAKTK
jgi:hypothetical protein